jgi:protein-tyrosine phosphatase
VIDIHSHLLPGVDDGSPSVEVSVGVLERFARQGVEVVVCTPHLLASRADEAPYGRHLDLLAELRRAVPEGPTLRLGWEIMLDRPGCDLRWPALALGTSRAVLVEFPRAYLPPGATGELERLVGDGLVPVVAHPERYHGCTLDTVRVWREIGAVIQTDATMFFANGPMAELAKSMLEEGLIDCLASDNHGDRRSLATARTWLDELGATELAALLTRSNAERVLSNQPVIPATPIRLSRGVWFRLRELVTGRK